MPIATKQQWRQISTMAAHVRTVRIYLEDTDAQGVVYHVNYLKYCERSRTDILLEQGFKLADLQARGWTLVVHEMQVKFRRPARLHDDVRIVTTAKKNSEYRITFNHEAFLDGTQTLLLTAKVEVVAISVDGDLKSLPDEILKTPVE